MLSVYDCNTTNTRDQILLFELCLKKETSLKKKKKQPNSSEARWKLFLLLLVSSLDVKMTVSVCVSVSEYARVVFLYVCKLQELLGPSAVQAC